MDYHRFCGFTNIHVLLIVLEAGDLGSGCQHGEGPFADSRLLVVSSHDWESAERDSPLPLLLRILIPSQSSALKASYFPKKPHPNIIRLGLQHMNFVKAQTFSPQHYHFLLTLGVSEFLFASSICSYILSPFSISP